MSRYTLVLGFVAVVMAVAVSSRAADDKNKVLTRRVYLVNDLPVFKDSKDGNNFDASILMAHIQSTVAPSSWMSNGTGQAEMQPFSQNHSLVVSQTEANHKKIVDLLESLRTSPKR